MDRLALRTAPAFDHPARCVGPDDDITTKRRRVNPPRLISRLTNVKRVQEIPDCFTGYSSYCTNIRRNPFVPAGMVTVVVVVLPPDGMLVCKGLQTVGFKLGDSSTV